MLRDIHLGLLKNRASKKIKGDWRDLLNPPPSNYSETTKNELRIIKSMYNTASKSDIDFIMDVDNDPAFPLKIILNQHDLPFPKKKFATLYSILQPIILDLKAYFNRPRPYELDTSIYYISSHTHQNASYPSGHVAYAALVEKILSEDHPKHSHDYKQAVDSVGKARIQMGVHYPSDNQAGKDLVDKLLPQLKKELP